MARNHRASGPTYHLERGAEGVPAFFVFTQGSVNRIEIVSIALAYVIFRVRYPERSFTFGFRFGRSRVRRDFQFDRVRLSRDTYRETRRLGDVLMRAVLAGYCPSYEIKGRGFHWLNSGERFKVKLLTSREFIVEARKRLYEFGWDEGVCFLRGSDEGLAPDLRYFLFGFAELALRAYRPYERVLGEQLDPLPLFPAFEDAPPRKRIQLRHRANLKRLRDMGKPAALKATTILEPAFQPSLFEPRTLLE